MNYFSETKMQESEMKKFDGNMNMSKESCCMGNDGMMGSGMMMGGSSMMGCPQMPIYECPQERVCHRYVCYEVPHIMPCNTRIINHHVFRHTYRPEYTCCEENVCENVFDQRCC